MITLTKAAADEYKRLRNTKGLPEDTKLRVGLREGPEEQHNVYLGFEQQATPADRLETSEGVSIVMQNELADALGNLQIDYVPSEGEGGHFRVSQK